jgi:hypothetical protein
VYKVAKALSCAEFLVSISVIITYLRFDDRTLHH